MWKTPFTLSLLACGAMMLGGCAEETKSDYIVCESTYALCTTASCTPIEEGEDTVFCDCEVKTGYSVGGTPCHDPVDSPEGKQIVSRYYPIKSYAVCTNDRPWAWCYDRPCIVDKNDPSKAVYACTIVQDEGPYVIVTETYSDSTCTTSTIAESQTGHEKSALGACHLLASYQLNLLHCRRPPTGCGPDQGICKWTVLDLNQCPLACESRRDTCKLLAREGRSSDRGHYGYRGHR